MACHSLFVCLFVSQLGQVLDDIRRVCMGSVPPDALLPVLQQLQQFTDTSSATPTRGKRIQMARMIDLMLFAENMRSAETLNKAMVKACKLLMPDRLFQALEHHMQGA